MFESDYFAFQTNYLDKFLLSESTKGLNKYILFDKVKIIVNNLFYSKYG